MLISTYYFSGADPGFPAGGGANPLGGGAPTYDFAKFCEKLHEIEKILGRPARPPLNPPLFLLFCTPLRNLVTPMKHCFNDY